MEAFVGLGGGSCDWTGQVRGLKIFLIFILSVCACMYCTRAIDEVDVSIWGLKERIRANRPYKIINNLAPHVWNPSTMSFFFGV